MSKRQEEREERKETLEHECYEQRHSSRWYQLRYLLALTLVFALAALPFTVNLLRSLN